MINRVLAASASLPGGDGESELENEVALTLHQCMIYCLAVTQLHQPVSTISGPSSTYHCVRLILLEITCILIKLVNLILHIRRLFDL